MSTSLVDLAKNWYRYQQASPLVKFRIEKRLSICDICSDKLQVNSFTGATYIGENNPANIFKCGLCKCTLITLASGLQPGCRRNKWPE